MLASDLASIKPKSTDQHDFDPRLRLNQVIEVFNQNECRDCQSEHLVSTSLHVCETTCLLEQD